MDELTKKIEAALNLKTSLHITFFANGREWVLSMTPVREGER